jgi:hypothetical protein
VSNRLPTTLTTEGCTGHRIFSVTDDGVSGISNESELPVERRLTASNVGLPVVMSSVLVGFVECATRQTFSVASLCSSNRSTGCCIIAPVTPLSLSESLFVSTTSPAASEAPRPDVPPDISPDISKGSSRNADHHGMFLNGVFLGVWATEEVVPAMRGLEELDGCEGDGGCGGVIAEDKAGATNVGAMVISGAGNGGDERLESCKS